MDILKIAVGVWVGIMLAYWNTELIEYIRFGRKRK